MSSGTDVVVSIAQVAAGGTIVQAMVALFRRRSELRQLDRQTESVAVDTADQVVTMLRTELVDAKAEIARLKGEREAMERQAGELGRQVNAARAELAAVQSDLARLRGRRFRG